MMSGLTRSAVEMAMLVEQTCAHWRVGGMTEAEVETNLAAAAMLAQTIDGADLTACLRAVERKWVEELPLR